MPGDDVQARLTAILRDVFDDETLVARPDMTADDVDDWDSLANIRLILTVEREFKVKFAASEVTSLKNVGALMELIRVKRG